MNEKRFNEILPNFAGKKIVVTGTFALDRYSKGVYRGVSRETGNKIVKIYEQHFRPGGAGNVAMNLAAMEADVHAVTVVGQDGFGDMLLACLQKENINTSGILRESSRVTPTFEKVKVPDSRNPLGEELRFDVDNFTPLQTDTETQLLDLLQTALQDADALIVADYFEVGSPIITGNVLDQLCLLARTDERPFAATSRKRIDEFRGFIAFPNQMELSQYKRPTSQTDMFADSDTSQISEVAGLLAEELGRPVIATLGALGAYVAEGMQKGERVPTLPKEDDEIDPTGAGDSFISAATLALTCGASIYEAAIFGNIAASITIQQLNTTDTASLEEIGKEFSAHFKSRK